METLAQWIHRRGALAPKDAVGWAIRLAKHLEALHLHGVAHGNISPACVLIETNDPHSRGLVADVRRTAEMVQYHSPERFRNGQLSPLDDAWGLAGTLFTALTAQRPFGEMRPEIEQRVYQGLPPLSAFGVHNDSLQAILAQALVADPAHRTMNVAALRAQLEHWFGEPRVRDLVALEDEEGSEEDNASTAMLPMDRMMFEESSQSRSPESLNNLFAPPSFDPVSAAQSSGQARSAPHQAPPPRSAPNLSRPPQTFGPPPAGLAPTPAVAHAAVPPPRRSNPGAMAPPPAPSNAGNAARATTPEPLNASPLGEQDATVMRELPAHIMALAARAASGSNPPPPPLEDPHDEPDYGSATKIAPAPDLAALRANLANNPTQNTAAPAVPPPAPSANMTGSGPRPVPRAFKATQLGMGAPGVATPLGPQQAASPIAGPFAPSAPHPGGFPAPPIPPAPPQPPHQSAHSAQSADPIAPRPGFVPPPTSISSLPPQGPQHDDDDGGRTVMRESPNVGDFFRAPDAPPPQDGGSQWKPAPPPVQPTFGAAQPALPQPGLAPPGMPSPSMSSPGMGPPLGPAAPPGPPAPPAPPAPPVPPTAPAVSALIQETLENMAGSTAPTQAPVLPALPGNPTAEAGAFHNPSTPGGGGVPQHPQAGGPFQPIGQFGGSHTGSQSFANAPWAQQGHETSGSFALGAAPSPNPGPGPGVPQNPGFAGQSGPFAPQQNLSSQLGMAGQSPMGLSNNAAGQMGLPNNMGSGPSGSFAAMQQPNMGAMAVAGAPGMAYPTGAVGPVSSGKRRSKTSLFVICFLVMILAAAVTFSVLRFRPQLGF